MKTITIEIPDDLQKILESKISKFEEAEIVTLPDGRKATTARRKYPDGDVVHQWVREGVLHNLLAVAPEWFEEDRAQPLVDTEHQRKLIAAAEARLRGKP